jgi:WD40 repeat protein/serine/threonine protein kinase
MAHGDLTGRTLGEFVLGERLGEGGHGVVYRAHQPALARDVVIKVLRTQRRDSPVAQERFLREAQLASLLDHPYAAHIYAFGVDEPDGLMWIAMELVHGVTLQEWLAARGPMPLDQLVPFIEHVAQVVHAAHQHGIVHRDLKPSNMMVIEQGGSVFPKLLDFGIAKAPPEIASLSLSPAARQMDDAERVRRKRGTARIRGAPRDERVTATRSDAANSDHAGPLTKPGSGSSAYMAPEQWRDAWTVGPASDIYSLGVIVYRALAGVEPFIGEHTGDYYRQHRDVQPPPLGGELAPVDRVLRRALAKSPDERHASALDLAADLRTALRASEREQLRAAAQQWDDRRRSPGLLWGREELPDLDRWARRAPGHLTPLECSFVAASQRRVRGTLRMRRALGLAVVAIVVGGLQYRSMMRAQVAEATAAQAELEHGRSALLLGDPDAATHLTRAYQHDAAPATEFMLARALQPRLSVLARLPATSGRMWSASFSPDGKRLLTSDDQDAQIWDVDTARPVRRLPHGTTVYQAIYASDGKEIFTAGDDDRVRIWDPDEATAPRVLTFKRADGQSTRYGKLSLDPQHHLVAAIDISGDVAHVWDTETGHPLAEVRNAQLYFPSLAFSADGRWLVTTGGQDVQVHDTRTWRSAHVIHARGVRGLAASPVSAHVLFGTTNGEVAIWELATGERSRRLRESGEIVDTVAWSADARWVAAASRDGIVEIWNAASGERISRFQARQTKIRAIEFDHTSQLVLAAGADGVVVVADVALGMPVSVLEGPSNVVWRAHFDPSGRRVAGASWDGTAHIWSASPPYRRWSSPAISDDCGVVTTPVPDGRYVAVGCRERTTRIWDTARDQLLAELPAVTPVGGKFTSAFPAVSAGGDRAAIAQGSAVEVYALPGGHPFSTIETPAAVTAVAFSPDGHDVASGSIDGSLMIAREGGALMRFPAAHAGIDVVAFTPDGGVLAVDADRRLRAYDRGGAFLAEVELPYRVMSLRIAGTRAIALQIDTGNAAAPVLIDLERHRVVAKLEGHVGWVFSARWVGSRIITAGGDGTVRVWDGMTGQLQRTYQGGGRLLSDAIVTNGGLIIAGGIDGTLKFWDEASGARLWTLPVHRSQVVALHAEGEDLITRGISGDIARWTLPASARVIEACGAQEHCDIVGR